MFDKWPISVVLQRATVHDRMLPAMPRPLQGESPGVHSQRPHTRRPHAKRSPSKAKMMSQKCPPPKASVESSTSISYGEAFNKAEKPGKEDPAPSHRSTSNGSGGTSSEEKLEGPPTTAEVLPADATDAELAAQMAASPESFLEIPDELPTPREATFADQVGTLMNLKHFFSPQVSPADDDTAAPADDDKAAAADDERPQGSVDKVDKFHETIRLDA
jgi:hypothetical protein